MANITLTIPDDKMTRVIDALAFKWNYDAGSGIPKGQFVKSKLIEAIKYWVIESDQESTRRATETEVAGIDIT